MKVKIYVANEHTDYEFFALQYLDSDIVVKTFHTCASAERFAKRNGYDLVC